MYGRGSIGMLAIDNSTADMQAILRWIRYGLMTMTPPVCYRSSGGNGKRLWRWYGNRDSTGGGARNNAIATNLEGGVIMYITQVPVWPPTVTVIWLLTGNH